MLKAALKQVLGGEQLSRAQARDALRRIMEGHCEPLQIAALLAGLRARGESCAELAGMAEAMREAASSVEIDAGPLIDTCGTGGDGAKTFNISTAAAFVAAAGGAIVAKHGNRSISSKCGSADVLEALGVPMDLSAERVAWCVEQAGIGFLFAPRHHPAMRHVMPIRRAMGVRTAFNLLGPMTNPAGAKRQVIGVFDPAYAGIVARALGELGSEHVWVVSGEDGRGGVLDELSTCGASVVHELKDGELRCFELRPEDVGLATAPVEALAGGDAAQNAAAIEAIFSGEPGPRGDAVALNAGAALLIAGLVDELREGVAQAQELLRSGAGGGGGRGPGAARAGGGVPQPASPAGRRAAMSDILAEIERRKRWEREILRDALRGDLRVPPDSPWLPSPEALKQAKRFLKQGGCEPRGRDFEAALRAEAQLSVIAEVKRASPSAGRIASWQDPDELATAYREAGADALSVLTDAHYFDGRPGFLGRCRDLFPGPLLRKDFLADEADLAISAALGADAVLLIVASLGPRVADLRRLAGAYGLHTLIEVHKRGELDLAMAAGASIIGINNRDLETFRTDLETSERLAALLPDFVCVVAESGIKVPADAERMRRAGADAVLVGESLSRAGGVGLPALRTTLPRGSRA